MLLLVTVLCFSALLIPVESVKVTFCKEPNQECSEASVDGKNTCHKIKREGSSLHACAVESKEDDSKEHDLHQCTDNHRKEYCASVSMNTTDEYYESFEAYKSAHNCDTVCVDISDDPRKLQCCRGSKDVNCGNEEGWLYYESGDTTKSKCFKSLAVRGCIFPDNALSNWTTASTTCKDLGGKLPMPYTKAEWTWFKENVLTHVPDANEAREGSHVWLDIRKSKASRNVSKWEMGDETQLFIGSHSVPFTNKNADYYVDGWAGGQPDYEHGRNICGGAWGKRRKSDWAWDDISCAGRCFVACERKPSENSKEAGTDEEGEEEEEEEEEDGDSEEESTSDAATSRVDAAVLSLTTMLMQW